MTLTCALCGVTITSVDDAIDAGWEPDFWIEDKWVGKPVCCDCAGKWLIFEECGECVLKKDAPLPCF